MTLLRLRFVGVVLRRGPEGRGRRTVRDGRATGSSESSGAATGVGGRRVRTGRGGSVSGPTTPGVAGRRLEGSPGPSVGTPSETTVSLSPWTVSLPPVTPRVRESGRGLGPPLPRVPLHPSDTRNHRVTGPRLNVDDTTSDTPRAVKSWIPSLRVRGTEILPLLRSMASRSRF